jgi:glyoxylase-like metal-dependent hydrolase (beta-lactamase superfamily II)
MLHALRGGATRTLPVVEATVFVDEEVLDLPGRPRVIHVPGHTAGHAAIIFEDRQALFVGDALATMDIESGESGPHLVPRFVNEDDKLALESLVRIEAVNARWLLPGHGLPWEGSPREAVKLAIELAALHR